MGSRHSAKPCVKPNLPPIQRASTNPPSSLVKDYYLKIFFSSFFVFIFIVKDYFMYKPVDLCLYFWDHIKGIFSEIKGILVPSTIILIVFI